jgi:hypothetical protein
MLEEGGRFVLSPPLFFYKNRKKTPEPLAQGLLTDKIRSAYCTSAMNFLAMSMRASGALEISS